MRIAFLGDSFVWGYDANAEERMTDLLLLEPVIGGRQQ
jgi:hypothetical protein